MLLLFLLILNSFIFSSHAMEVKQRHKLVIKPDTLLQVLAQKDSNNVINTLEALFQNYDDALAKPSQSKKTSKTKRPNANKKHSTSMGTLKEKYEELTKCDSPLTIYREVASIAKLASKASKDPIMKLNDSAWSKHTEYIGELMPIYQKAKILCLIYFGTSSFDEKFCKHEDHNDVLEENKRIADSIFADQANYTIQNTEVFKAFKKNVDGLGNRQLNSIEEIFRVTLAQAEWIEPLVAENEDNDDLYNNYRDQLFELGKIGRCKLH